jgi:hypothetical protein
MHEWQILRPSENSAVTIGFVWARDRQTALKTAIEKFSIDAADAEALIAVRVIGHGDE